MARFDILEWEDVLKRKLNNEVNDPEGFTDYGEYGPEDGVSFLYDNTKERIVYDDMMEPEDACLYRSLRPLVDLLNNVAKGY